MIGYPVNPILEFAARADVRPIIVRQERTGLHMADAVSRVSSGRRIGVFAMQHGPGSENAFGGVAQAWADAVPIVVLPMGYPRKTTNIPPNFNSTLNFRHVTKWAEQVPGGRRGGERDEARVHPGPQRPPGAGAGRGSDGRLRRGRAGAARVPAFDAAPQRTRPGGGDRGRRCAARGREPGALRRPGRALRRGLGRAARARRAAGAAGVNQPPGQERVPESLIRSRSAPAVAP